ncbi:hypothetical protein KAZ66_00380 [Candidatus Woesebacteria bacterium]|nr:hypothetical protein [Candidatus Woesebacteria bacterium]
MTATEQSPEVTTSTPITPKDKVLQITIDQTNAMNFNLDGPWSLHEALGALALTAFNVFSNNVANPGVMYLSNKIDALIAGATKPDGS